MEASRARLPLGAFSCRPGPQLALLAPGAGSKGSLAHCLPLQATGGGHLKASVTIRLMTEDCPGGPGLGDWPPFLGFQMGHSAVIL